MAVLNPRKTPHQPVRATEAYDLAVFEKKKPELAVLKPPKKKTEKRISRAQRLVNVIIIGITASAIMFAAGSLVDNHIQITEVSDQIMIKKKELKELESRTIDLSKKLAAETSSEKLDDYIKANNMQKTDPNQIRYLPALEGDRVETTVQEELGFFESIVKAIEDFFA